MLKETRDIDHLPEQLLTYSVVKMILLTALALLLWIYLKEQQPFVYPYLFAAH